MLRYNGRLKAHSQELRGDMTDAERRLWSAVRMRQLDGLQFYRQRIIGDYIVDFYCPRARLVIEVDGGQHYSGKIIEADRLRDAHLRDLGLRVLRFSDIDVLTNLEGAVLSILENITTPRSANPP